MASGVYDILNQPAYASDAVALAAHVDACEDCYTEVPEEHDCPRCDCALDVEHVRCGVYEQIRRDTHGPVIVGGKHLTHIEHIEYEQRRKVVSQLFGFAYRGPADLTSLVAGSEGHPWTG